MIQIVAIKNFVKPCQIDQKFQKFQKITKNFKNISKFSISYTIRLLYGNLSNINMEYKELCNTILEYDPAIRYAGVWDSSCEKKAGGIREGQVSYLDEENTKVSVSQAITRWQTRKFFSDKTGEPEWAIAKYKKMFRITVPVNEDMLLISAEPESDPMDIINKVFELIK